MSRSRASVTVPRTVQGTIEAFVAGVRARFGGRVARIRLFGSYARGEASEESDVDGLVLLDRVDREDDRTVTALAADLIWQRDGVVISPMVMSDAEFEAWKARERATPLAIALLLTEGIEPRSHAGASSLLGLHFVRTGRLSPDDARLFARIQKYRLEADYARDFVLTSEALREDLDACTGFLARVRALIGAAQTQPVPAPPDLRPVGPRPDRPLGGRLCHGVRGSRAPERGWRRLTRP